ncbi:MAG: hypothetical protein U9Q21_04545, partial [Candidatus Auribacterota bacterium]|nr:hypothetical protein [Candidatus Auribacterota bacterium]
EVCFVDCEELISGNFNPEKTGIEAYLFEWSKDGKYFITSRESYVGIEEEPHALRLFDREQGQYHFLKRKDLNKIIDDYADIKSIDWSK